MSKGQTDIGMFWACLRRLPLAYRRLTAAAALI
jgi:hypothetical protein